MQQRADVSKLLGVSSTSAAASSGFSSLLGGVVARGLAAGRAGSDVASDLSGAGGQRRRRPTAARAGGSSSTSSSPSSATANGAGGPGGATGAGGPGSPLSRVIDVLRAQQQPVSLQQLQVLLGPGGVSLVGDRALLQRLRAEPCVHFDPERKLWAFLSPYREIGSAETLLGFVRARGRLELSGELLAYRREVAQWVARLLAARAVRAVRAGKNARCKVFSSESGLCCDLYAPAAARCDACKNLTGVILYPLAAAALETAAVDPDLKRLWHSLPDTPSTCAAADTAPVRMQRGGRRKRAAGGGPGSRAPKFLRVANVHIYTTEDLADGIRGMQDEDGGEKK